MKIRQINPQFIADVEAGMSSRGLAEKYECSITAVFFNAKQLGLSIRRAHKIISEAEITRRDFVVTLREGGATYQKIANKIGVSRERVRQILHLANRSDLCCALPKDYGDCRNCGKKLTRNLKHCDQVCASEYTAKTLTAREKKIIEAVHVGRFASPQKTWREIAEDLDFSSYTRLPGSFKIACAKIGADHTLAHRRQAA